MDGHHFDRLTRSLAASATRRGTLRGLAAGLLATTGLGTLLDEIDARRNNGRHNNKRRNCGDQYTGCNENNECCHGLICKQFSGTGAEANFPGTCAYKRGCGLKEDFCGKNRDCCHNFRCRNARCRRRPNN
jgi:hypothetical protein